MVLQWEGTQNFLGSGKYTTLWDVASGIQSTDNGVYNQARRAIIGGGYAELSN